MNRLEQPIPFEYKVTKVDAYMDRPPASANKILTEYRLALIGGGGVGRITPLAKLMSEENYWRPISEPLHVTHTWNLLNVHHVYMSLRPGYSAYIILHSGFVMVLDFLLARWCLEKV